MPAVYRVSWLFEGKSELLSLIVKQETGANNIWYSKYHFSSLGLWVVVTWVKVGATPNNNRFGNIGNIIPQFNNNYKSGRCRFKS